MAREIDNIDYAKKVANLQKSMAAYEVDYENKLNAIKFHNLEELQAKKERYIEAAAQKESKAYEKQKSKIVSEAKLRLEQNEKYLKASAKQKEKLLKKETEAELKKLNKITAAKIQANAKYQENLAKFQNAKGVRGKLSAIKDIYKESGGKAIFDTLATSLASVAKQLESSIDSIGNQKGIIDTALQGSKNATKFGSY